MHESHSSASASVTAVRYCKASSEGEDRNANSIACAAQVRPPRPEAMDPVNENSERETRGSVEVIRTG